MIYYLPRTAAFAALMLCGQLAGRAHGDIVSGCTLETPGILVAGVVSSPGGPINPTCTVDCLAGDTVHVFAEGIDAIVGMSCGFASSDTACSTSGGFHQVSANLTCAGQSEGPLPTDRTCTCFSPAVATGPIGVGLLVSGGCTCN